MTGQKNSKNKLLVRTSLGSNNDWVGKRIKLEGSPLSSERRRMRSKDAGNRW